MKASTSEFLTILTRSRNLPTVTCFILFMWKTNYLDAIGRKMLMIFGELTYHEVACWLIGLSTLEQALIWWNAKTSPLRGKLKKFVVVVSINSQKLSRSNKVKKARRECKRFISLEIMLESERLNKKVIAHAFKKLKWLYSLHSDLC